MKNVSAWFFLWFVLLILYGVALHYKFHIDMADHVVYFLQLLGDSLIGVFGFLAYRNAKDKNTKKFLLTIFLSICFGLFANEAYNLLFNIIELRVTYSLVNDFWLIPYTLFLCLQLVGWIGLNYSDRNTLSGTRKKNVAIFSFLQSVLIIVVSMFFTSVFKDMIMDPLGFIQVANTLLELALFFILSVTLARSKTREVSYLSSGFLLLLAFNLAQRFSYMSGYYYKTFDVAWFASLIFIIFGLVYFYKNDGLEIKFHNYNSLHVMVSSILMIFTSMLFLVFSSLEFFIESLEINSIAQLKLLAENMPSVLIFSFTMAVIISKFLAKKTSISLGKLSDRVGLLKEGRLKFESIGNADYTVEEIEILDSFILSTLSRLQIANQAKSEFLMNMSHDFRTPASGIHSMSKLVHKKITDKRLKMLQKLIVDSSGQLLALLDDVLEHSRLSYSSLDLKKRDINVVNLVKDVISFLSAKAEEKGLFIRLNETFQDIYHCLDSSIMYKILLNLISNAIKFTEYGGVEIDIEIDERESLILTVKDSGIGVSPDKHDLIFEPFIRVESPETSKYSGIGLGLSNVCLMLRKLDGTISLSSEPGFGSMFRISIPK